MDIEKPTIKQEYEKMPKNVKFKDWANYIGRKLCKKEKHIINNFKMEYMLNCQLHQLHEQCEKKNLFVPHLTELIGNCLFESFYYHNIGNSVKDLRKQISLFLQENLYPECKFH